MKISYLFFFLFATNVFAEDRVFCHFDFYIDGKSGYPADIYISMEKPFKMSERAGHVDKKKVWPQVEYWRAGEGIIKSVDSKGNVIVSLNFYLRNHTKMGYLETLNKEVKLNTTTFVDIKHYEKEKDTVEVFCMKDLDLIKTVKDFNYLNKIKSAMPPEPETIVEMVDYMRSSDVGKDYDIPATKDANKTKSH
ncbi:MAG: hypothetical protein JNM93_06285 [Bacteriovoracaceae bacterium]|nr:hypothetical protein [Bacteriovoracaceae bacterium]